LQVTSPQVNGLKGTYVNRNTADPPSSEEASAGRSPDLLL
jgi:hypothetical protein